MSGIVGSKLNIRGSGLVGSLGTDGQHLLSSGAGVSNVFETVAAGGGKVGQVVSTTVTAGTASCTADAYEDMTGMTVDITPAATSSKIWVSFNINIGGQKGYSAKGQLVRDSTAIAIGAAAADRSRCTVDLRNSDDQALIMERSMNYVDSPSTTSAVTYKLQWKESEDTTLYLNRSYQDNDDVRFGRAASTITVVEVLA